MTLRELLGLITPAKLGRVPTQALADALHDSEGTEAPPLVRVFTAIGTWIGAAMVATILAAMRLYQIIPLAVVLGVGLFAGAIVWSRAPGRSLVVSQLIWAMALGAHGLLAGAADEADVGSIAVLALIWTVLNIAMTFLIRVPSFQLASAVCAVGFGTLFASQIGLPMYPLWVGVPVAALATAAWIREVPWAARLGRTWAALAYGLPIGALIPMTMVGLPDPGDGTAFRAAFVTPPFFASVAIVALIGVVLWQARRELTEPSSARSYALGVIALLIGLSTRNVPGLSLALLWLLVAHLRKSAGLQTLATIQLGGFLFFFYYQLDTTLLLKSLWVISTGALLLLGAWLARRNDGHDQSGDTTPARRSRWLPAIALSLLTSGLVVGTSLQKQHVIATGQTVLLPLAPVDPRSLMQGDYMRLRYELEDEITRATNGEPPVSDDPNEVFDPRDWIEPFELRDQPRHGRLVIEVDDDRVAHFVRFDDGSPLAERELLLEYRLRDNDGQSLRVGAESFLFEEGTGELYARARFGELVVAEDGESVLIGLRDGSARVLGVPSHQR